MTDEAKTNTSSMYLCVHYIELVNDHEGNCYDHAGPEYLKGFDNTKVFEIPYDFDLDTVDKHFVLSVIPKSIANRMNDRIDQDSEECDRCFKRNVIKIVHLNIHNTYCTIDHGLVKPQTYTELLRVNKAVRNYCLYDNTYDPHDTAGLFDQYMTYYNMPYYDQSPVIAWLEHG